MNQVFSCLHLRYELIKLRITFVIKIKILEIIIVRHRIDHIGYWLERQIEWVILLIVGIFIVLIALFGLVTAHSTNYRPRYCLKPSLYGLVLYILLVVIPRWISTIVVKLLGINTGLASVFRIIVYCSLF